MNIPEIIKQTKAFNCLECGKCTSVCPIALLNNNYNPRLLIRKAVMGDVEELAKDVLLWTCLTCKQCEEWCDYGVAYTNAVRDLRALLQVIGIKGTYAHSESLQTIMRIMTSMEINQRRLDWLTEDSKVKIYPTNSTTQRLNDSTDLIYFIGCLPYFDKLFGELELNLIGIATATIKILNAIGIEPVVMANERCCGHDLLWTGDYENFKKLASLNIEEINKTGAKKLVTSCAECYWTLKENYPQYVAPIGAEIIHISQLISQNLSQLTTHIPHLTTHNSRLKLTYHDPCRLGRFAQIYDEPRAVLNGLGERCNLELKEMNKSRKNALCCGTNSWFGCGTYSKQIQINRLKEAKSTGAELLITSCPKCQIHFKCAMKDENTPEEAKIEIQDMTTLIVRADPYGKEVFLI